MTEAQNNSNNLDDEIINDEQFAEVRELFEEDFVGLLQTYFTDSRQRVEVMKSAQLSNDNAGCFESSHALKGASATIGATQLVGLTGRLEAACRAHRVKDQAQLIENISLALQAVEQEINQRLG